MLGNFNLYHELWGGPKVLTTYIKKSEELLFLI